jgi:hypothetical protein
MRVVKILPLLTLCLVSSLALADEKDCSDLSNSDARQECMKRRASADVDCSKIDDADARRDCAQRKQQNGADCSRLGSSDARQECVNRKRERRQIHCTPSQSNCDHSRTHALAESTDED